MHQRKNGGGRANSQGQRDHRGVVNPGAFFSCRNASCKSVIAFFLPCFWRYDSPRTLSGPFLKTNEPAPGAQNCLPGASRFAILRRIALVTSRPHFLIRTANAAASAASLSAPSSTIAITSPDGSSADASTKPKAISGTRGYIPYFNDEQRPGKFGHATGQQRDRNRNRVGRARMPTPQCDKLLTRDTGLLSPKFVE